MAQEQKPGTVARFYKNLMRFSPAGLLAGVLLLAFLLSSLVNRIGMLMPAEMQLILQLMKNRFFR